MAIDKKTMFDVSTKKGFKVFTFVRNHDKQVIVSVTHGDDIIKLVPVDTDEELSQWFWKFVDDFGGDADG